MIKFSRNSQIIFYIIVLIFVILFFFYFYQQASVVEGNFLEVKVETKQPSVLSKQQNINLNIKLFTSEKFRNLKREATTTQSFQTGKRNPFESY